MTKENNGTTWRNYLKGIGMAAGTTALGSVALSGSSAAEGASLNISNPNAVTTDDGRLQYVAIGGDFEFSYDGLDTPADYGYITGEMVLKNKDGHTITAPRSLGGTVFELAQDEGETEHAAA